MASRWFLALVLLAGLLATATPAGAQEVVDPRTGRLLLTVTDLVVPAGPVSLPLERWLDAHGREQRLLGLRWRLNWESRLFHQGDALAIEEGGGAVFFSREAGKPEYRSSNGDRVVMGADGRAIRHRLDETTDTFDARGRLVERELRNGNRIALRYGPDGRLARIEGPGGGFLELVADGDGRLVRIDTPVGRTVRYVYRGPDLVEVQADGGRLVRYAYDTSGRLTRTEDPATGAVELTYDGDGRVVRRRWADGAQERYEYDDAARTVRQIDPAGAVTTTRWSEDRQRADITDPLGHRSTMVWDAAGRLVAVTGPTGATIRTRHDALGRTVEVEDPTGRTTRFEYVGGTSRVEATVQPDGVRQAFAYDGAGNLTAIRIGAETVATFTYDPDGRMATASGAGYAETRLAYHPDGALKSVSNALGEVRQFEYDARGNLSRETNPVGGVTLRSYDAADRLASLTDPAGRVTRYAYDAGGRLSQVTGPAGTLRFDHDARGRLVAETDVGGQTTRYAYDPSGRLVRTTWPDGRTESTRYDAAGHPVESVDGLGRATAFGHDPLGRLVRERWPTGLEIRYRFDALGRLAGVEDSLGSKVQLQRDRSGRIEALSDALGATTRYRYDPLGNMLDLTDARGQSRSFTYGPGGLLTAVREASGDAARYEYDAAGRMVAVQHPGGGTTRFVYDALGNVVTVTDPLGGRRGSAYDPAGRLVSTTDAGGRVTRRIFEPSGRLAEIRFPDGRRLTHRYDAAGRLLEADDGAFPVRRAYDAAGRLVRVEYPAITKSIAYEYDAQGLRTRLTDADGRAIRYEYNAIRQLAAVVLPDGRRIVLAHDAQGRQQSVAYPNGITGRWEYDAAGRTAKIAYLDQTGRAVAGWTYRYDPAGDLVERQDAAGQTWRFRYDATGQLVEESGATGATRYRYSAGGNRAAVETAGVTIPYRHDAADRIVEAGEERLSWDGNGNLIARRGPAGTTAYEYDAAGRLVKVVAPDGSPTALGYAPTGERIWKRDRDGLRYFLHDGLDLIQEIGGDGQSVATYIHGAGVDRPLAMLRDGRYYFFHADRLGSVALVTDERGQTAAAYEYDAFGRLTTRQGTLRQPFAFTGREWDASTGLYYYRARYYDPVLGRFLSLDPLPPKIGDPLTLNPYLYVRNNPVRFVDPLGASSLDEGLPASFSGLIEFARQPPKPAVSPQNSLVTHIRTPEDFFHYAWGDWMDPKNPMPADWDGDPVGWMRTLRAMGDLSPKNKPLYDEIIRQLANRLPPRPPMDLRVSNPPPGEGGWPLANPFPKPDVGVTRGGRFAGSETVGGPRPPMSQTMPAPQSPVPEPAPAPAAQGGKPIGVGPGSINLASGGLSVAAVGISIDACMKGTGRTFEECAKELAKGMLTKENLAIMGGTMLLAPLAPFVAAGAGAAMAGGGAIASVVQQADVPAVQAEVARQAWWKDHKGRFDAVLADLAGLVASALGPPRQEAFDARGEAREQAVAARAAADQARALLDALRGLRDAVQKVAGDCAIWAAMLPGQIVASAAEARQARADMLGKAAEADAKAAACSTKEAADELGQLQQQIEALAAKGQAAAARTGDQWVQLGGILERAETARESLGAAEQNAAEIARQAGLARAAADAARAAAARAEAKAAELEEKKAAMLARLRSFQGIWDFPEAQGRIEALIGHATALASLPADDVSGTVEGATRDATRAEGYASEAQTLLAALKGLPLCAGITSPDDAVNEAPTTGEFANAGADLPGKIQVCLARVTPAPDDFDPSRVAGKKPGDIEAAKGAAKGADLVPGSKDPAATTPAPGTPVPGSYTKPGGTGSPAAGCGTATTPPCLSPPQQPCGLPGLPPCSPDRGTLAGPERMCLNPLTQRYERCPHGGPGSSEPVTGLPGDPSAGTMPGKGTAEPPAKPAGDGMAGKPKPAAPTPATPAPPATSKQPQLPGVTCGPMVKCSCGGGAAGHVSCDTGKCNCTPHKN